MGVSAHPRALEKLRERGWSGESLLVVAAGAASLYVLALIVFTIWTGMRRPLTGLFWVRGTGSVRGVMPGTPAAAAGLRRGDVILSVDGVPARLSVRRSIEAYTAPAAVEKLAVSVLREGRVRSVDLRMVPPPALGRL
jgi:S1-C subfamily serine protease